MIYITSVDYLQEKERRKEMKRGLCLTLIIIVIAGFALTAFGNDAAMQLVIDVRTVQEWDKGHLEGAVLIPYDQIGEQISSVVKDDLCVLQDRTSNENCQRNPRESGIQRYRRSWIDGRWRQDSEAKNH